MVKHDRRAARGDEDRHAVADHEGIGSIDLEPVAVGQRDSERPKGRPAPEGPRHRFLRGVGHELRLPAGGFCPLGDTLTLTNAAATSGIQRAAAVIASRPLTGDSGWTVNGLAVGTSVAAAGRARARPHSTRPGVDTSATPRVWAVVDHNSQFAVVPVPEPATWLLLAVAAPDQMGWLAPF